MQPLRDIIVLLLVERVAGISFLGRIDHHFHKALAYNRRAQRDADEFIDLGRNFGIEADKLEIPSAVSAFAYHPF